MYGWLEGLGIIIRPQEQPSPVALRSWEINISAVGQDDSQDQSALFPRAFLGAWAAVTQRDDLIITHLVFPISVPLPLWGVAGVTSPINFLWKLSFRFCAVGAQIRRGSFQHRWFTFSDYSWGVPS